MTLYIQRPLTDYLRPFELPPAVSNPRVLFVILRWLRRIGRAV
jgi:hypothetical protein